MSHMAIIDITIQEDQLDALELACQMRGIQLNRGQSDWRWFGSWMDDYHRQEAAYKHGIKPEEYGKCADHVITVPGNDTVYEIGVVRRRDGQPGWMLVYDFFNNGNGMGEFVGNEACNLLREAFTEAVSRPVMAQKFNFQKGVNAKTGRTQLRFTPKQQSVKAQSYK